MRNLQLFIAALALVQCVRYGRSALRFIAPSVWPDPGGRDRRAHLIGFLVVVMSLVLLASSIHMLLRAPVAQ